MKLLIKVIFFFIFQSCIFSTSAQIKKAPDRNEGDGHWSQFILRGATVVNGTGAPPVGPMDIVIEGNVKYTIKDGIVYDAKKLLADVKAMVDASKKETGTTIKQPGIK